MANYPVMTGAGELPALHEIHIFLAPINPDETTLQRYYTAVEELNVGNTTSFPVKACHLGLVFRGLGEVRVMQSARYFRSNSAAEVIAETHRQAEFFRSKGFEVVREKIEATAYGIDGIPLETPQAIAYPNCYFEFHIKVLRKNREDVTPVTSEEIAELLAVFQDFSAQFNVPVPLSYNLKGDTASGHQRFLNLRCRGQGLNVVKQKVKMVEEAVAARTSFQVVKTISEYVWFDTYCAMDKGWIDFDDGELHSPS